MDPAVRSGWLFAGTMLLATVTHAGCPCPSATSCDARPLGLVAEHFRVAVAYEHTESSHAASGPHAHHSQGNGLHGTLATQRVEMRAALTVHERLDVLVALPLVTTRLDHGSGVWQQAAGAGDPAIHLRTRVLEYAGVGTTVRTFCFVGLETPWGQNDLRQGAARLSEHLQPGSGSWDGRAGVAVDVAWRRDWVVAAQLEQRWNGANDTYHAGSSSAVGVVAERRVFQGYVTLGAQLRHAEPDTWLPGDVPDPNTGGNSISVLPSVRMPWGRVAAQISVRVPVFQDLRGDQHEGVTTGAGLTLGL